MNLTKSLTLLGCLTVLALFALQELRFRRALDGLRAELAAQLASAEAAATSNNSAEETREAVRQLSQSRAELAAAQRRLAQAADQIQQFQAQRQALVASGFGPRALGAPVEEGGLDSNPSLDRPPRRAWGEEQATGPPDTFQAGDISTAWAPRQPDGGEEWLHLDYSNLVQLAEVRVRETYNPGAISKVAAVLPNGQEVVVWEGVEEAATAPVDRVFPVAGSVTAGSVRVYLDTRRVSGWNEIDAVELAGRDGSRQWGARARASSSYATR